MVPRFFFDVHDGVSSPDAEGIDLPDLRCAQVEAVRLAGAVLIHDVEQFWRAARWSVTVREAGGRRLFSIDVVANMDIPAWALQSRDQPSA